MESVPRHCMKPLYHEKLKEYDVELVQELWEDCIMMDIPFMDPFQALSNDHYKDMIKELKSSIAAWTQQGRCKGSLHRESFRKLPYSEQKVLDELLRFEVRMMNVRHRTCQRCNCCSLVMKISSRGTICSKCHGNHDYSCENAMIPLWEDQFGMQQNKVPEELSSLSIGEKLLIQRVSPLVPIVHIKNGTLGIKGHVCSFMQDISGIAETLPLLPEKVKAIRMIRSYESSGSKDLKTKTYMVNRSRVMGALHWLCRHHIDYREAKERGELKIDEKNLDWMKGREEANLCNVSEIVRECDDITAVDGPVNHGVSRHQCMEPLELNNSEMECSGVAGTNSPQLVRESEENVISSLKSAHKEAIRMGAKSGITTMDWPQSSSSPLSECSGMKIFANAFPWLFPGGIGDVVEPGRTTQIKHANWGKQMLFQKDGRFAQDKLWCFFALNYIQRHRNMSNGGYFVENHISDPPKTLQELQQQIKDGNTSFISKVQYFSKNIRGSDAYWRDQRSQLYSWINYHIERGNGPPTLFITLSCAEYFWPDMIRLLEERTWIAEGYHVNGNGTKTYRDGRVIDFTTNTADRNKAVNDYSIVVQEFFQIRTKDFLGTVGRKLFGIQHYWLRYEFAKGRGQIHAHLLAILDTKITRDLQASINNVKEDTEMQAEVISEWAQRQFGMSAELKVSEGVTNGAARGSSIRLGDVKDHEQDISILSSECQMHQCSEYCMRKKKNNKRKEKR